MTDAQVRVLTPEDAKAAVPALAEVLIDCVERGASVSFMAPLSRDRAEAFWTEVAEAVARGERALLAAFEGDRLTGTVQLILDQPENQPHRADIGKMLVHGAARRQGVAGRLMAAAEDAARDAGKTLLVLDTASPEAMRVYERQGWTRVGVIPDYALLPDGRPCDTVFYFKRV